MLLARTTTLALLASLSPSAVTLAQCQDKLLAGMATDQDQFGFAVAQSARYAVVSAVFEDGAGAAYVYEPSGGGWIESGRLVAALPTGTDQFGTDVDVSGNTVLVGAPFSDSPPLAFTGSAHVFVEGPGGWVESQVLHASDLGADEQFGFSVSVDGTWLAVGAPFKDLATEVDAGAVYVFELQAGTWVERDRLEASDGVGGDLFGLSVSLSGDTLLVGAPFDDDAGMSSGSAYVFRFDGTSWSETQKLGAGLSAAQDEFAREVSVDGVVAVVGARNDDDAGQDSGAAYVFRLTGPSWTFSQKLKSLLPLPGERFGTSVGTGEGKVVVGNPFHGGPGAVLGSAHVFTSLGGGWIEQWTLDPSDGVHLDRFGSAVAFGGGRALVGATQNDEAAQNAGAAYGVPLVGSDWDGDGTLDACDTDPYLDLCNGDGGDGAGCSPCACGNEAPAGTCGGCLNGTGSSARLVATGTPSILNDTMRVELVGANPGTFAVLLSGSEVLPSNPANPCYDLASGVGSIGFDGLRCIGGVVVRHGLRPTDASGDVGVTNSPWGATPFFNALAGLSAGQTRHYQAVYREVPTLVCGTGLNTSQAVLATLLP